MAISTRHPLFQQTPEHAGELIPKIEHKENVAKTKEELVSQSEELIQKVQTRMEHVQALVDNTKTDPGEKATLKATLSIMKIQLDGFAKMVGDIKAGRLDIANATAAMKQSGALKAFSAKIDMHISLANKEIEDKFGPLAKRIESEPEQETKAPAENTNNPFQAVSELGENFKNTLDSAGKAISGGLDSIGKQFTSQNQTESASTETAAGTPPTQIEQKEEGTLETRLPSDIFVAMLRPLPRPAGEAALDKTQLTVELNKLSNENNISAMSELAESIQASLNNALAQLSTDPNTAKQPQSQELKGQIQSLRYELATAGNEKTPLFNALLNSLAVGDSYVTRAQILSNRPNTRSEQTENGEEQMKEFKDMTPAERQAAVTALSKKMANVQPLSPEVGAQGAPLTADNLTRGEYVGDMYRVTDGVTEKLPKDYFVPSRHNLINAKSIQITTPNTFTYKEGSETFTVEVRSIAGVETRKLDLTKAETALLSDITRLPVNDSEKTAYTTELQNALRSQLGDKTYFSVRTKGDKTGELIIKKMPGSSETSQNSTKPDNKPTTNAERVQNKIEQSKKLLSDANVLINKLSKEKNPAQAKQHFEQALAKLDKAKNSTPNMPELYYAILVTYDWAGEQVVGRSYTAKKIIDAGEKYLQMTSGNTVNRQYVLYTLGIAYGGANDLNINSKTKALEYYKQAVGMEVNNKPVSEHMWVTLLDLYIALSKYTEAQALLNTMKEKKVDIAIRTSKNEQNIRYFEKLELAMMHHKKEYLTYEETEGNDNFTYHSDLEFYQSIANSRDLPAIENIADDRFAEAKKSNDWQHVVLLVENMLLLTSRLSEPERYAKYLAKATQTLKDHPELLRRITIIDKAISNNGVVDLKYIPLLESYLKNNTGNPQLLITIIAQTYLHNEDTEKAQQYMGVELPKVAYINNIIQSEIVFNQIGGLPFQKALLKKYYGKHMTI